MKNCTVDYSELFTPIQFLDDEVVLFATKSEYSEPTIYLAEIDKNAGEICVIDLVDLVAFSGVLLDEACGVTLLINEHDPLHHVVCWDMYESNCEWVYRLNVSSLGPVYC